MTVDKRYKNLKNEKVFHYLYKTTNIINGKFYIGVHSSNKLDDSYLGSSRILKNAIKKYGRCNFKKEILSLYDSYEEAFLAEAEIVNELFISRKDTYNVTIGGSGNPLMAKGKVTVKDKDGNTMQVDVTDERLLTRELQRISTGKVRAINKDGEFEYVDVNDMRFITGEIKGFNYNKVTVKDKDGNTMQVDKTDSRYISGELVGIFKGKIVAKDIYGNKYHIDKDDERLVTGELVHNTKGLVVVKDKDGNMFSVSKDDPRYISGELVSNMKAKCNAKDKDGNKFFVDKDDPRFITGELVGIMKGVTAQCPYCNKIGGVANMKRYHFENCKKQN